MDLEKMLISAAIFEGSWYAIKLISVMGPDFPDHPSPGTPEYKRFNRLVLLPAPLDLAYLGYEIAKHYFSNKKLPEAEEPKDS